MIWGISPVHWCWTWTFQVNTWNYQSILVCCTALSQCRAQFPGNCLGPPAQELPASSREANCTGRNRTYVCTWWQEGQQEQLALGFGASVGGAHLCWSLVPASCEGTSVLFSQVPCASAEANFASLPAKPGVTLVQYHRGRAPLLGLNWELNAMLGAATGHAELSLFKGLGLCKGTKGIAKPQTMKTTLNERLNERKKVVKMSRLMFS